MEIVSGCAIKRNNKIVAIINIIFGIFMCVGWYLFTKCMMIDVVTYWGLSKMQNILAIMGTIALILPLLTTPYDSEPSIVSTLIVALFSIIIVPLLLIPYKYKKP